MENDPSTEQVDDAGEQARAISPVELLLFLGKAARRHVWLEVGVALVIAALSLVVVFALPAKYEAQARILAAQSGAVAAALSNPNRPISGQQDPFAGSDEFLLQRANLLTVIRDANVLPRWKTTRSLPLRLKDKLTAALRGPVSEADLEQALIKLLEKRLHVWHDMSVLTISVQWFDAESTYRLAQAAQTRFLELHRSHELAGISAAISINEEEVKHAAETVDQLFEEVVRARDKARRPEVAPAASATAPVAGDRGRVTTRLLAPAPTGSTPSAAHQKLAARLAEIRQQARDIEGPWQRRVAELKYQLGDLRSTYGPEHPAIVAQETKIREVSEPPPELVTLRQQESQLLSELEAAASDSDDSPPARKPANAATFSLPSQPAARAPSNGVVVVTERDEDPAVTLAKANLSAGLQKYSDAKGRYDTSRLELTTAQVAFQYRFIVVTEPEWPQSPAKPGRPLMILLAVLGSALIGFLSGAVRDLLSGRLVDPWQAKGLGLQVLGEVPLRRAPGRPFQP